jgi:hypothetical protein
VIKEIRSEAIARLEQAVRIDQRTTALEKLSDRTWQIWLALIAAGLALGSSVKMISHRRPVLW